MCASLRTPPGNLALSCVCYGQRSPSTPTASISFPGDEANCPFLSQRRLRDVMFSLVNIFYGNLKKKRRKYILGGDWLLLAASHRTGLLQRTFDISLGLTVPTFIHVHYGLNSFTKWLYLQLRTHKPCIEECPHADRVSHIFIHKGYYLNFVTFNKIVFVGFFLLI